MSEWILKGDVFRKKYRKKGQPSKLTQKQIKKERKEKLKREKYARLKAKEAAKKKRDDFKKPYKDYLKSKEWAEIRTELFESRGRNCERCGSTNKLQVHHLTYKNLFNEEPEDLEILCSGCHMSEHAHRK